MRRCLLLLLLVVTGLVAQSFFNPRGLGELAGNSDARLSAQSGPSALSDDNPGIPVRLDRVKIRTGGLVGVSLGRQNFGSRALFSVRPTGITGAVPLPASFRLTLAASERFCQDFDIWSDSLTDTLYRRHIIGRGGIYALSAGIAHRFLGRATLGLQYSALLGGARENWRYTVGGNSSTDTIETDYRGGSLRAGLGLALGRFSAGAWFEPGQQLTVRRLKKIHGVVADSIQTRHIDLPWSGAAGLGLAATDRLSLTLGASLANWENATLTGDGDSTRNLGFRNSLRTTLGMEYYVVESIPVRFGLSHGNWYYSPRDGGSITETGLHAGTGLAIAGFGTADIAAAVLLRSASGLHETALRLAFSLSYGEIWARRTRRWGY